MKKTLADILAVDKKLFENNYKHQQHLEKTGFWGRRAAGSLFLALDTGRILFALRSNAVQEPNTYGTWGGAMDDGETPENAAKREASEEMHTDIDIKDIMPLLVFNIPKKFTYYNFLTTVDHEFAPNIHHDDNWETAGFKWVEFGKWPVPLHPGTKALLSDYNSLLKIKQILMDLGLTKSI